MQCCNGNIGFLYNRALSVYASIESNSEYAIYRTQVRLVNCGNIHRRIKNQQKLNKMIRRITSLFSCLPIFRVDFSIKNATKTNSDAKTKAN